MNEEYTKMLQQGTKLTMDFTPTSLYGKSLASILPRKEWDRIRAIVKKRQNNRCFYCDADTSPLFCHKVWEYDLGKRVRTLTGFQAVCRMCNWCLHVGLAHILADEGKYDISQVREHYCKVNSFYKSDGTLALANPMCKFSCERKGS